MLCRVFSVLFHRGAPWRYWMHLAVPSGFCGLGYFALVPDGRGLPPAGTVAQVEAIQPDSILTSSLPMVQLFFGMPQMSSLIWLPADTGTPPLSPIHLAAACRHSCPGVGQHLPMSYALSDSDRSPICCILKPTLTGLSRLHVRIIFSR